MLKEESLKQLHSLIHTVSREELIWINGYLSALVTGQEEQAPSVTATGKSATLPNRKFSLVYGTETGNSKRLAGKLAGLAKKEGWQVKLSGLDQYRFSDLDKEEYFFVVISTQGEGEPPAPAKKWFDHIHQPDLLLPRLKYAVLALGDSAYPLFCKAGEEVDQQLQLRGASRILPLEKCDVDYEEPAETWFRHLLATLEKRQAGSEAGASTPRAISAPVTKSGGKQIHQGIISRHINLNDRGSRKKTYHIEISCSEAVAYQPGDALALVPQNPPATVEKILALTGIDRNKIIQTPKYTASVEELLSRRLSICYLLSSVIRKYAGLTGQEIPETRMDLLDLLRIYPVKDPGQFEALLPLLTALAPRLYSISSSPSAHTGEIHLTVAKHEFSLEEEKKTGLCSGYLSTLAAGTEISFYIHPNRAFRLPPPDKDLIMIGPGTGVAPFRSFLFERDACAASGRNWFFFGEQHFVTDFLYQTEIQTFLDTGVLQEVSLAFSRDQEQRIYVQHRMLERSRELFAWLEQGAYICISGRKDPMSAEVEQTWLQIIAEEGSMPAEEAARYWENLKQEGRYQKDVY